MADATDMTDAERLALAGRMFHAWDTMDWDGVVELFSDDAVLHSVMQDPIVGRAGIDARIHSLGAICDRITLHIKALGVIDGKVFVQRVDDFDCGDNHGDVPVVGILSMRGGRVTEWLEYYDRATLLAGMGVTGAAAH